MINLTMAKFNVKNPQTGDFEPLDGAASSSTQIQADWNQTNSSASDFIKNKPTLGNAASKGVDSAPTSSSTNLVESGGVATALSEKADSTDVGDISNLTTTDKSSLVAAINEIKESSSPTPLEEITEEGALPLVFNSNGDPAIKYSFTGDMTYSGVPSKTTPLVPQEVGDFVASGVHSGEYEIPILINSNLIQTLYLNEPLRKIGSYSDAISSETGIKRRITKLVLTGNENWTYTAGMQKLSIDNLSVPLYLRELELISVCSHYTAIANQASASLQDGQMTFLVSGSGSNNLYIRDTAYSSADAFKTYLQNQYAAGTPVCIWYVVATESTSIFTAPTLILENGQNILTIGTTLSPSYASITCMIGDSQSINATGVGYDNTNSGLAAQNVQIALDEIALLQAKINENLYGKGFFKATGSQLSSGDILGFPITNIKKNNTYSFLAKISGSFSGVQIGQGFETYSGAWIEINSTKIIVHNYTQTDSTVEYTHGLTISDYLYVQIFVETTKAKVVLFTNGTSFTQSNINWYGCNGEYFIDPVNSTFEDYTFAWSSQDFRKPIWIFGDSYIGLNNLARWATQFKNVGLADNVLFNGYAGENSANALIALTNALTIGKPEKLIWCLGMNDGADSSSTTPSTNWENGISQVKTLCENNGIELIMATIPSVPSQSNEAKCAAVRASGNRYIDFAAAVGAQANGTWYTGMLSQDNVHPTETGAIALYNQVIADCPELTYSPNKITLPIVDQVYNSSSINAQSGVAVASAISGKISATDYASQNTGGTVKVWTTTDGTDTVLHIATQ